MFEEMKAALSEKMELQEGDLALINAQALAELKAEEVFVFRVAACDDQVDRDNERFPVETLEKMAEMFVGRTVIMDHRWSAGNQTARIFKAQVEEAEGIHRLVVSCYMLDNVSNSDTIQAIKGGILKEVSVGCSMGGCRCNICGNDGWDIEKCPHFPGQEYEGQICHFDLIDPLDAYELSFVAVPAQPGAGVIKGKKETIGGWTPAALQKAKARLRIENERWK